MLLEMATLTAIQDVMEHLQVQFPGEVIEASISDKVGMIFGKLFSSYLPYSIQNFHRTTKQSPILH